MNYELLLGKDGRTVERIWALRGAITISQDTGEDVLQATRELLEELFLRNGILADDIVSIIFTVTTDIQSEFPAVAARQLGLTNTPLICTREIPKTGALALCIRVLMHFYTTLPKSDLKPVYLREAVKLRPDLQMNSNTEME